MRRRATLPLVTLILLVPVLLGTPPGRSAAAADPLPPGFSDAVLVDFEHADVKTFGGPTALAHTPDGRLLIARQRGGLRVYRDDALLPRPALDLAATGRLCDNAERGLLGVAVDPAFTTNRAIYLYYTLNRSGECPQNAPGDPRGPVNRVARFTLPDSNIIDPGSEVVLLDNIPSPVGIHNAGDLRFGADGFLYVSAGDGGCDYAGDSGCAGANDAARDRHTLLGKILRITRDGGVPPGNPFTGPGTAPFRGGNAAPGIWCQETFAWGLRNPFRFAFKPGTNLFYVNDTGQGAWEEIDRGQGGADYGWPLREGPCVAGSTADCGAPPAGMTNPIHTYGRDTGCAAITGGAFVPNGVWPREYDGNYLFGDFVCGKIFRLKPDGTRQDFVTGLGGSSAVHLTFGPCGQGQALYYSNYNAGQVRRITHQASGCGPVVALRASPTHGPAPLTVGFDGSGSVAVAGDALTYLWDFGDGATAQTTGPTTSHLYSTPVNRTATLRVRDRSGRVSAPATVRLWPGDSPPAPTIASPAPAARFAAGQWITVRGDAADAEDGQLPGVALSWRVILHHETHLHPFLAATVGPEVTFTAPAPEDLAAAANSFLEIELTATVSRGLSATVSRELRPATAPVHLATEPDGLTLQVNGVAVAAPRVVTSWEGYGLTLAAPIQAGHIFMGWTIDGVERGWANPLTLTTGAVGHAVVAHFAPLPAFGDVPASHPRYTAIGQLAARGIVQGYADGRFGPADPTLRAQTAALIARAMGWAEESHPNPFPDQEWVDDRLWQSVGALNHYDVARGFPDGGYKPTGVVLQAQAVSLITRAMVAKGYWQPQRDRLDIYPNVPAGSGHRQDLATFVHYAGPVPGTTTGQVWYGWDQPITRSGFAATL